jgi:hypothetical protein
VERRQLTELLAQGQDPVARLGADYDLVVLPRNLAGPQDQFLPPPPLLVELRAGTQRVERVSPLRAGLAPAEADGVPSREQVYMPYARLAGFERPGPELDIRRFPAPPR